jgi:hypothetical protein
MRMRKMNTCVAMVLACTTPACSSGWNTSPQPAPRVMADVSSRHLRLQLLSGATVGLRHAVLLGDSALADARPEGGEPYRIVPISQVADVETWHSGTRRTLVVVGVGALVVLIAAVAYVAAALSERT